MSSDITPSPSVIPKKSETASEAIGHGAGGGADKEVSLYAARVKIYPRSVRGVFANWRWALVWITQIIFYGLPWLQWGERQAVLFDLGARRFYVFGLVLYPQDFIYLTGLLVISALSLFLFTAVAGRLWCGYACPQTVYTEIFIWLERLAEGDRSARMRRDAKPWHAEKIARKVWKHGMWLAVAFWTGFTFVGYFTPIRGLVQAHAAGGLGPWEIFWTYFYGFATYGNAGFMREQVCKYMCPYARFQSAMFDKDTLVVTYDRERGEPRGARNRKADPKALNLGACVDCDLCVQVCPTGIDIRRGLQYECIGCGACVDVCNTVMDKMGYERQLVRYTTENALSKKWSSAQTWRHVLRPRVLVYTSILLAIVLAMVVSLSLRAPFKVNVVRDRGVMARQAVDGRIENVYRLQIMNATESQQSYTVSVDGMPDMMAEPKGAITIEPAQAKWVVMQVLAPVDGVEPGSHPIHFVIEASGGGGKLREKSTFFVPR